MKNIKIWLSGLSFFVFSTITLQVFASGVDLDLLYGSRYVGLGGNHVTLVDDAYGPFYNPAAMSFTTRRQMAIDFSPLVFTYEAPLTSANNQRTSDVNLGPLFYVGSTHPLSENFTFGWALYPTALQGGKFSNVDYGNGITNKEYSNKLVRIELAPALSIKVTDNLSFGAAWKLAYTQYDKKVGAFSSAVGSSYIDNSLSSYDAKGFKFGFLLNDFEGFSAGLTYRPGIGLDLEGDSDVTAVLPTTVSGIPAGTYTGVLPTEQTINLPAQLQAGLQYEWLPKRFMTIFTFEWTQNSSLDADAPIMTAPNAILGGLFSASNTRTRLDYKDGMAFHFGGEYTFHLAHGDKIRSQLGYVYDRASARRGAPNPVLAPSNAYNGYAIGSQYDWGSQVIGLALNYGQYHTNISASEIDTSLSAKNVALPGKYELKVFFASLDYQYRF